MCNDRLISTIIPRQESRKYLKNHNIIILSGDRLGETSAVIRKRVQIARDIQTARFGGLQDSSIRTSNIACNADMRVAEVRKFCPVLEPGLPQAG
jgi:predicted ATPase with chaperone activity